MSAKIHMLIGCIEDVYTPLDKLFEVQTEEEKVYDNISF